MKTLQQEHLASLHRDSTEKKDTHEIVEHDIISDEDEETDQEETNPHTSDHWNILKSEDELLFGLLNSLIR